MSTKKLIEINDLHYQYPGAAQETLRIQEFHIAPGEQVFLYGPSGSGKTTLLEILAGILKATQGEVRILDRNLSQMPDRNRDQFRAEHLGYIFQSFNLIPYLTVQENIELPLHLSPTRRARLQEENPLSVLRHLCTRLGIITLLDKKVTELSVGQQQRVAVARALFGRPELILADEPTSALDMDHREKFLELLFELCEQFGTTVLFVSHDRSIQHLFTRAVALDSINRLGKEA